MGVVCASFIVIASLVAPLILGLVVVAVKVSAFVIPVVIVAAVALDIQRRAEEERVREAARIAEIERERLRREHAIMEAEARRRARIRRQAEAEKRDAIPGAIGWFVRAMHGMVSASSGDYEYQDFNPNPAPSYPSVRPIVVPPTVADSGTGGDCAVCCDRAANTLLMPCKHLALCGVS